MNIGHPVQALRQSLSLLRSPRGLCRTRNLSVSCLTQNWRNETPPGGLTEILVYTPESQIAWPDPSLGVFAKSDPRFVLPGNIGVVPSDLRDGQELEQTSREDNGDLSSSRLKMDVLEEKTSQEHQAQTLYSAHDFIHFTSGVETYVCSNPVLLDSFPSTLNEKMEKHLKFELHDAPQLLRKELKDLFPDIVAFNNPNNSISVITMARETVNDMSMWSEEVEVEREVLVGQFVILAREVCGRLKNDGYWADFIDPSAGVPYFGQHTNTTMFETDEKYRLLGFRIEDLGCCKVICHKDFGRKVFVGTMVTSVPASTGVIQELFKELKITNLKAFLTDKPDKVSSTDSIHFE